MTDLGRQRSNYVPVPVQGGTAIGGGQHFAKNVELLHVPSCILYQYLHGHAVKITKLWIEKYN